MVPFCLIGLCELWWMAVPQYGCMHKGSGYCHFGRMFAARFKGFAACGEAVIGKPTLASLRSADESMYRLHGLQKIQACSAEWMR